MWSTGICEDNKNSTSCVAALGNRKQGKGNGDHMIPGAAGCHLLLHLHHLPGRELESFCCTVC